LALLIVYGDLRTYVLIVFSAWKAGRTNMGATPHLKHVGRSIHATMSVAIRVFRTIGYTPDTANVRLAQALAARHPRRPQV
jgi:hypothetical protein